MPKTTLLLDDAVFRQLKKRAAGEGRSLQATTNDLLRQALSHAPRSGYRLKLRGWEAGEQPAVDLLDRDKLVELMERTLIHARSRHHGLIRDDVEPTPPARAGAGDRTARKRGRLSHSLALRA